MTRFVDELAEKLAAGVRRLPSGALSLAHLLVVVPTAQSGRRLRAALAKRLGAFVPPLVKTPSRVLDVDETDLAGRTDEILAFWEAKGPETPVELAAQLADIRAILGANALTFAEVAARLASEDILKGDLADVEIARWQELAEVETRYLAALARRGKTDRVVATQARLKDPPRYDEIERIVVAGVLDPIPLMERALVAIGKPVARIDPADPGAPALLRAQVTAHGTASAEAEAIAAFYAGVKPDEALPALCLADAAMFTELKGALQAKGLKIHNPAATRLVTSSLGHLVAQVTALLLTSSYQVFSSFLRSGDVRRWVCAELKLSDADFTAALVTLDQRQQELLPETLADIAPKTKGRLRQIFEFIQVKLRKCGVREILEAVFRDYILDEHDESAREFAAAAETVNALVEECFAASVPEKVRRELFALRLDEATYALEPDEGDVILTDGWLELPYLAADELVVAGFQEGAVPEAVVGHPFVPDALRAALGLPSNATRTARDRRILATALACREPAAVRLSFHAVDAAGDVLKPSRLVFETEDDAELLARARAYYGVHAGTAQAPCADLPDAWKLHLPVPPEHQELTKMSPTRFDSYLRDPFTAYLKEKSVLGDKRLDDRAEELASWEYGNLAHGALERWGLDVLAGAFTAHEDAAAIYAYLEEKVDQQLAERFGTAVPAIVAMQGESVKRRLRNFADVQVARYREGWRLRAVEEKLEVTLGHTRFTGKCDRIDFNDDTGKWCVIDYKTWDKADRAQAYEKKKDGRLEWHSFQLPLYCAMLNASADARFRGIDRNRICAAYCVLGKTRDAVLFTAPTEGTVLPEAEKEIGRLVARYEAGVFWPPTEGERAEWVWDYQDWLAPSPRQTVDAAWIADQERRRTRQDEIEARQAAEEAAHAE